MQLHIESSDVVRASVIHHKVESKDDAAHVARQLHGCTLRYKVRLVNLG